MRHRRRRTGGKGVKIETIRRRGRGLFPLRWILIPVFGNGSVLLAMATVRETGNRGVGKPLETQYRRREPRRAPCAPIRTASGVVPGVHRQFGVRDNDYYRPLTKIEGATPGFPVERCDVAPFILCEDPSSPLFS
eukprot:gene8524-biopygen12142